MTGRSIIVIQSACERCGVWHHVTLSTMNAKDNVPDTIRPICWLCGERGLATIGQGLPRRKQG